MKYINVISVLRGYSDSVKNADIETKKDEVKDIEEAPGRLEFLYWKAGINMHPAGPKLFQFS